MLLRKYCYSIVPEWAILLGVYAALFGYLSEVLSIPTPIHQAALLL